MTALAFIPRTPVVSIAGVDRILYPIQGGAPKKKPKKPTRFPVEATPDDLARIEARGVVMDAATLDAVSDLLADMLVSSWKRDQAKRRADASP